MPSGQTLSIQDFIQELIEAEPDFSAFAIYQRKEGQVQAVIGEKEAIEIGLPRLAVQNPDMPLPFFEGIQCAVRLLFNRTVAALTYEPSDAAERLAAVLHLATAEEQGEAFHINGVAIEHTEDSDGHSIKTINITTAGGVATDRPQVATPILTGTTAITVTCATAGAQLFYTLNGDYPNPRNGTLYSGPVAISSGQTIKVIGWLAGYTRSQTADYTRP